MAELAPRVDGEDARDRDPHGAVRVHVLMRKWNMYQIERHKKLLAISLTERLVHDKVVQDLTHVDPVAVSGVEGVAGEELDDVPEAGDLELFWLLLDDLAVEGVDERGGVEEHGSVGQVDLALPDGGEVVLGDARLPDGARRQVQDVVVVGHDLNEGENRGK